MLLGGRNDVIDGGAGSDLLAGVRAAISSFSTGRRRQRRHLDFTPAKTSCRYPRINRPRRQPRPRSRFAYHSGRGNVVIDLAHGEHADLVNATPKTFRPHPRTISLSTDS